MATISELERESAGVNGVALVAASRRARVLLGGALISLVTALVYANSFKGVFVLDDKPGILDVDMTIFSGWQYLRAFHVAGERWTVTLSLLINQLISPDHATFGYHLFNLLVHVAASLAVYGFVRRTFLTPRLASQYSEPSTRLALVIALIFAVHPLQTESVTYIIQRAQAIMGLFEILAFYCIVRAEQSPRRALWQVLAILSFIFALDAKPHMVGAIFLVPIYDCAFQFKGSREALRRQWPLYATLICVWAINVGKLTQWLPHTDIGGRGANPEAAPGSMHVAEYALSQFKVICHYLKLSVWPDGLCLDYVWPIATTPDEIYPYALVVLPIGVASLYGIWRANPWGFLGAWFCFNIGATSSLLPRPDLCVEHRMYTPLLSLIAAVVMGARYLILKSRLTPWTTGLVLSQLCIQALAFRTIERNKDYYSALSMWQSIVEQRPNNPRAHNNVGYEYQLRGELDKAEAEFHAALAINPRYWQSVYNMGNIMELKGRNEEAPAWYESALKLYATYRPAIERLAYVLNILGLKSFKAGKYAEAEAQLRRSIVLAPKEWPAHYNLGLVLAATERYEAAVAEYTIAENGADIAEFNSQFAFAEYRFGEILMQAGQFDSAVAHAQSALTHLPGYTEASRLLATIERLRADEGLQQKNLEQLADQALQASGADKPSAQKRWAAADAINNLGLWLRRHEKLDEAAQKFQAALAHEPGYWPARYNLGLVFSERQQFGQAITEFETAEKLNPAYKEINSQCAYAEGMLAKQFAAAGHWDLAAAHARNALKRFPVFPDVAAVLTQAEKMQNEHLSPAAGTTTH